MRKKGIIWLFLLMTLTMGGCATMPPPVPGTINLVNSNEGAYGYGVLFRENWSKDNLLAIDPTTGGLMWAVQPVLKGIKIESALSHDFWKYLRLDLVPNQRYTMYIFWTRFYGRELGESIVHFRAYADPRRRCHVDRLGRRTCASEIVYLPRVNTTVSGSFRIKKTFYTGQAIKDLIGLP
jgi:hypothetical protein